eukprot:CAMPEP_0182419952 /NCGR_PEP_ID=MMETSP1167-20130531/4343_1 /TAXON_ID=2988 /ORGANISM="Mallomonas Sp, Strain CCMP3275" /LENGTH=129 /DNA_ID=CAMNT_0024595199 /DNA_START=112 /DNA_END=501 /DNA_ORIENTATION=+
MTDLKLSQKTEQDIRTQLKEERIVTSGLRSILKTHRLKAMKSNKGGGPVDETDGRALVERDDLSCSDSEDSYQKRSKSTSSVSKWVHINLPSFSALSSTLFRMGFYPNAMNISNVSRQMLPIRLFHSKV